MSSKIQTGAAVGAAAGGLVAGGIGVMITDEDLLGSPSSPETGDTSLPREEGIAASVAIGVVVGAIVGAMVGNQQRTMFDEEESAEAGALELEADDVEVDIDVGDDVEAEVDASGDLEASAERRDGGREVASRTAAARLETSLRSARGF